MPIVATVITAFIAGLAIGIWLGATWVLRLKPRKPEPESD